jgi:hypothetical protein
MKKSNIIILAVVVSVIVVATVGSFVFLGMVGSIFSANSAPELKNASVAIDLGGGYNTDTGMFNLDGTAQNMGEKDATNCRVEVTFFNVDTNEVMKTEMITIGDVPAESSKTINASIQIPNGSTSVSFHIGDPLWDSR